jgi:hypothetical protein
MESIAIIKKRSWQEIVRLFRQVDLHGDAQVLPYKKAKIESRMIGLDEIKPLSLYVLKRHLEFQEELRNQFLREHQIDTLDLDGKRGGLVYRVNSDKKKWLMAPPIVEVSQVDGGVPVLVDGQHRFLVAKKLGLGIRVIWIDEVMPKVPLIAKPVEWSQMKILTKVPELTKKRDFRYKWLSEVPDISSFSNKKPTKKNLYYFFYRDLNKITSSAVRKAGLSE